jgi:hypothetical protein
MVDFVPRIALGVVHIFQIAKGRDGQNVVSTCHRKTYMLYCAQLVIMVAICYSTVTTLHSVPQSYLTPSRHHMRECYEGVRHVQL